MAATWAAALALAVSWAPLAGRAETAGAAPTPAVASPIDDVIPVIRGEGFVSQLREIQGAEDPILAEPLVADLWILYVLDLPTEMRFLARGDAARLGVPRDQLRGRAETNLANRLGGDVSIRKEGQLFVVRYDDNYESSLLLIDEIWQQVESQVSGTIVAAAPNRNVVIFATHEDAPALATLRQTAAALVRDQSHPISARLLVRRQGRWEALGEAGKE